MKTREEIEKEYASQREAVVNQYYAQIEAARAARDAALAELDDPTRRLLNATKTNMACRECGPVCISCQNNLKSAIYYAEQRRAQG